METGSIVMMVFWMGTVTVITAYFFWKVLTAKKKPEPDSYSGNDDEK